MLTAETSVCVIVVKWTTKTRARLEMEEVRKEILQWYEILALQFREKELQRVLHADVMLVFDHLVNAGVFEGTREYVEIKQHSTQ